MRELKVEIQQHDATIKIAVMLDNVQLFTDTMEFLNSEYAEGQFADMFHDVTLNRYKQPTEAIISAKSLSR